MTTILTRDLCLQRAKGAALLRLGALAHRHHLDATDGHTAGCYCSRENYSCLMLVSTSTEPVLHQLEHTMGNQIYGAGHVNVACSNVGV